MAGVAPEGAETGLALFVTTIQLAIAAGSVLGGVAVTSWGIDADFRWAGVVAFVGAIAFVALAVRRPAAHTVRGTTEAVASRP